MDTNFGHSLACLFRDHSQQSHQGSFRQNSFQFVQFVSKISIQGIYEPLKALRRRHHAHGQPRLTRRIGRHAGRYRRCRRRPTATHRHPLPRRRATRLRAVEALVRSIASTCSVRQQRRADRHRRRCPSSCDRPPRWSRPRRRPPAPAPAPAAPDRPAAAAHAGQVLSTASSAAANPSATCSSGTRSTVSPKVRRTASAVAGPTAATASLRQPMRRAHPQPPGAAPTQAPCWRSSPPASRSHRPTPCVDTHPVRLGPRAAQSQYRGKAAARRLPRPAAHTTPAPDARPA